MNAGPPRRVLLVSAFDASYIAEDAAILATRYDVRRATGHGVVALVHALTGVLATDIVYCWFLSVYGAAAVLLAGLLGRRSVIVLGGVDVADDRATGYGLWISPWKSSLARRALRSADLVLVVSETLREDAIRLAGYDGGNIRHLPTGYDPQRWTPAGGDRTPGVLCVAAVSDLPRLGVKGIDVLVEAARRMPEVPVTVIGVDVRFVASLRPPPNVTFLPAVARDELRGHYSKAKVYCQPSRREGLPNALCEAMLCGCIPVATDAGGSRHAVGETGYIAPAGDAPALVEALRLALAAPPARGEQAHLRIAGLFPLERRKSELPALLDRLFSTT